MYKRQPEDYAQKKHFQENVYYLQSHNKVNIGFILKNVVRTMMDLALSEFNTVFDVIEEDHAVVFRSQDFESRNVSLAVLATALKDKEAFDCLSGWRNERYAVYVDKKRYVLVERALSGLLGIITYGIHVNGFVRDQLTGEIKIWVPRRSATKPTWPLMFDNIIAGGLGHPSGIYETVIKESLEEANLPQSVIETYIKPVGAVSYFYFQGDVNKNAFQDESSLITGEVEYLYDLELPPSIVPRPNDGEVDSFQLLTLQETINSLRNKEFKPNCGLVMLEFLIRHGYIHPENELNYLEIVSRMHRRLPFPTLN